MQDDLAEMRRHNAIVLYGLIEGADVAPSAELDDLVATTKQLLGVGYAAVHILARDTQQTLASTDATVPASIPREQSICAVVMANYGDAKVIEVPDATEEPLLQDNPFVDGELGTVRFYAATPLVGREGIAVGTLCVVSDRPRVLTATERRTLLYLGYAAVHILDANRRRRPGASVDRPT